MPIVPCSAWRKDVPENERRMIVEGVVVSKEEMLPQLPYTLHGEQCLIDVRTRTPVPVLVFVDAQPFPFYSSRLDAAYAWDIARIDLYTARALAIVRIFTPAYLERQAALATHFCDQITATSQARDVWSVCP